jgi:type VI secretion system protein ImpH
MATESRRTDPPLDHILYEEGFRFDFFQAVRVIERLFPNRRAVGGDTSPSKEAVRFRSLLSLTFPPSAVQDVARPADENAPAQMTIAFMGLTGLTGVLPRHYTELLLERVRYNDTTLRDFLDIFNHRMISLFYRAWEKYRFPIAYERSRTSGSGYDPFSECLFHFVGMGTRGLQGRMATGDEVLLHYGGLLVQQPRSASALEAVLRDYFDVPVKIEQFVGAWLRVSDEYRTRLGGDDGNNQIGMGAFLGSRSWDQQAGFRIKFGPLKFERFRDFLPSGWAFKSVVQLTRLMSGAVHDFSCQLIVKASEVPKCELRKPGANAFRLGWSSWLKTRDFSRDADQAILGSHLTRIQASHYKDGQARMQGGIGYEPQPEIPDRQTQRHGS